MTPTFANQRYSCLTAALLFTAVILYSAPHRVHHAFDPEPNGCSALTLIKTCPAVAPGSAPLLLFFEQTRKVFLPVKISEPLISASPFSIRAPPEP